jgi:2',3'-cyclic-nucleotide 2'-phosphodiesterase (5'-nucleotidase family)
MCTVIKAGAELKGSITYNDIFNICPYEDSIVILSLSRPELKKIIKEQNTYKDKYREKLRLFAVDSNGKVTNSLTKTDESYFTGKKRIKVAFSSYDIAGAGNRYPLLKKIAQSSGAGAVDTQVSLRDAAVKYIRDNPQTGKAGPEKSFE